MSTRICGALAFLTFALGMSPGLAQDTKTGDEALRARIEALERELQSLKEAINAKQTQTNDSKKVEELDQKVRVMERKRELEQEESAAKAASTPIVSVGAKGFSMRTPDGAFSLRLRSLVQADSRFYVDDGGVKNNDMFLIRRARIELTGTIFDKFDYRLMPDFAGSSPTLMDAWLNWKIAPSFQVVAGKVKLPVGLERYQARESNLMTEFGYPTSLVPNRDIGVALHGQVLNGTLDYYVGAFDGTVDGGSTVTDKDDDKSMVARLFATPFANSDKSFLKGIGFGIAGTVGNDESTPAEYKTVGQQTFFSWNKGVTDDGTVWRVVPQLYYYNGPFGLLGEYAVSSQELRKGSIAETVDNKAWEVTGSWVLTGENATFRGVEPKAPVGFGERRGWGAWQVVARVTELDVDHDAFPTFATPESSAERARSYGAGLNWYLNTMVRISTDYNWTSFSGASMRDEHALFSRVQLRF